MSDGTIPPRYRRASGSDLIAALANALSDIKEQDRLTDKELAVFLGKGGQDSGKAYRTGFAEMPVTPPFFAAARRGTGALPTRRWR